MHDHKPTGPYPPRRFIRLSCKAWSILALSLALACASGESPIDEAASLEPKEPSWQDELPTNVELESVSPQDWYWAAVPDGAGASLTLLQSSNSGKTWVDDLGRAHNVSKALLHPFSRLKAQSTSPVLFFAPGQGLLVGALHGEGEPDSEANSESFLIDWNGQTVKDHPGLRAASLGDDSPWRIYGDEGQAPMRGLEIARSPDTVWILGAGGQVEKRAASAVQPQPIRQSWQLGEQVSAFTWATGFQNGQISEVLEPGLRFEVSFEDGSSRSYFFDHLALPI